MRLIIMACVLATRFWNHNGLVHKELWLLNCYDYYLRHGNYSQLLYGGQPRLIRTAAKYQAKMNCRRLTDINCRYYGFLLMRTLTQGPYSVRDKGS